MTCNIRHRAFVTGSRRDIQAVPEICRQTGQREAADLTNTGRLLVALSVRARCHPIEDRRLDLAELTFNGFITVFAICIRTGGTGRSLIRLIHRLTNLLQAGLEFGRGRNQCI
jgi:hypothetical protein